MVLHLGWYPCRCKRVPPSEGIDGQGGATAVGRVFEHPIARDIVDIPLLVGAPGIPLYQLVEVVVGERAAGAAVAAAGRERPSDLFPEKMIYYPRWEGYQRAYHQYLLLRKQPWNYSQNHT